MKLFSTIFYKSYMKGLLLSFLLGFSIRLIPEVLSYPYPIGFDTVYYAARTKNGVVWLHWSSVFSTWLLYAILVPVYRVVGGSPFLVLKLTASVIYGLNVAGIYYFSVRALNWGRRKVLMAAFFFAFQLASLGLSWQYYRNMLGLGVLLFTLPLVRRMKTKRGFSLFIFLSLLVVFSHEYTSVILFTVVLGMLAIDFLKGGGRKPLKILAAISPALAVFLTSVVLIIFPIPFHVETNIISVNDSFHPSPGGLFFLVNYLGVRVPIENYSTYLTLFSHVLSLFSILYLLWVPLVLLGFFRDKILDVLTALLLFGSFNCLITPFCALDLWFRWMLMLVYPFTFYAVNGIEKVLGSQNGSAVPSLRLTKWMRVSRTNTITILSIIVLLGSLYLTTPLFFDRFGVLSLPTTYMYIPSSMLHNTVPLRDARSTVQAIEWLNDHMTSGSCALIHEAFLSWSSLYLDNKSVIISYTRDTEKALNVAIEHGFDPIYLIWWNENIGWYGLTVPECFTSIFRSDRIAVFRYNSLGA